MNEQLESKRVIAELDVRHKQTLVDLLLAVQCGNVSCRRAATEILIKIKECLDECDKP